MQELPKLAAAFCLACICAELVSLLTDARWARRCIKAVTGLYILVVILSMFDGSPPIRSEWAWSQPAASVSFTADEEQLILSYAAEELERTLSVQCQQKFGVSIGLDVLLEKGKDGNVSAQVEVAFLPNTGEELRGQVLGWLGEELGGVPSWREDGPT